MIGILTGDFNEPLISGIAKAENRSEAILFSNNVPPSPFPSWLSVMQIARAYNFNGSIVAETIATAEILCSLIYPENKFFYVHTLEWMSLPNMNYLALENIYNNDNIDLIAGNLKIYKILESLFKKPVAVMESWDLDGIRGLTNEH
jgi:hypothetical protein|tara:strand:+ start:10261 stop:10698 length:438 start_codon:yes stop_codon:yes gene_type:complete